ncbi:hypothetical protein PUN28_011540 [Cardiocondyla obscurior]|uniref:Uncharacterized protein n=1 Tax=Cardiocondyla obscurior TaxID=286306 RepID=A0AAW2FGJ6_9HYME
MFANARPENSPRRFLCSLRKIENRPQESNSLRARWNGRSRNDLHTTQSHLLQIRRVPIGSQITRRMRYALIIDHAKYISVPPRGRVYARYMYIYFINHFFSRHAVQMTERCDVVSIPKEQRTNDDTRAVERLQAGVPESDKNAPKQITIPVSADSGVFHLCLYTKGWAVCVRYDWAYRSAAYCRDYLEICARTWGISVREWKIWWAQARSINRLVDIFQLPFFYRQFKMPSGEKKKKTFDALSSCPCSRVSITRGCKHFCRTPYDEYLTRRRK